MKLTLPSSIHQFLTRCVAVGVGMALVLNARKLLAEENYGGYRHEFYREDGNRMSIDTDTVGWDIGLNSNVRLSGEMVYDAISGATPNGAPPQSQWPYVTRSELVNANYQGIFTAAINDLANRSLLQNGLFGDPNSAAAYSAYTNYIATDPSYAYLHSQAAAAANTAYGALTNNPFFRSTSVPLQNLHDTRRAISFAVPLTWGIHQLTPEYAYSAESDYHSHSLALNYSIQLNQKNTTLNAGWSHNMDRVRDDLGIWEGKVSDDALIGLNQLITSKSYCTVNLTYGQEYGYLSDPYRGVMALFSSDPNNLLHGHETDPGNGSTQNSPGILMPEVRPRRRTKETIYVGYTQFVDKANGSFDLGYHFFHDSFGINAQTADAAWHQKIGRHFVLTPSFRYYYQTAASFYTIFIPDAFRPPSAFSSDYRLSRLNTYSLSVALTYRIQKHVSLDVSYMRYVMQGLDGMTSQTAYPCANVYSIGARIWF